MFQCDHGGEFDNYVFQNILKTNMFYTRFLYSKTSQKTKNQNE